MNPAQPAPLHRILVIDDNRSIHEDYRKVLQPPCPPAELDTLEAGLFGIEPAAAASCRYELDFACQGEIGLQRVTEAAAAGRPYEVVFLDMRMPPGWDGIDTATRLWEADPDLQIVICTAHADYTLDEMFRRLRHPDQWVILKKPFENAEIQQLARSLAEKWRLARAARENLGRLEQRVRERTAELDAANALLQAQLLQRAETEETLRQNQKIILRQERLAAIGEVAAGVAHDFNNILTIIQGNASLLMDEPSPSGEAAQSLQMIEAAAQRGAQLIRQLLAFSRQQPMNPAAVQINDLVRHTCRLFRGLLGENIHIRQDLELELPTVWADAGKLEQVLVNLAVNARDAMPRGGELSVHTALVNITEQDAAASAEARVGQFVCLTVADTGCGMSAEVMARIFEPFFTTKETCGGTGLGLATVYGILKQHGGWVTASSEPGKGSAFRVFLPASGRPLEPAARRAEPPTVLTGCETILLVEDEASVRELLGGALKRFGYTVLEAATAVEAFEAWRASERRVDLLVTDVVLPGKLTGVDLCERLRVMQPDLPAILTSGYGREIINGEKSLPERAVFLAKPFDLHSLAATVRQCLDEAARQSAGLPAGAGQATVARAFNCSAP